MFRNDKKGIVPSIIYIIVLLFVFGLCILISVAFWGHFVDQINSLSNDVVSPTSKALINSLTATLLFLDKAFIILFIVLWIGLIITSITAGKQHPAMFFIYIIAVLVITFISMFFSNFFEMVTENTALISAGEQIPATVFFFTYYPFITFVVCLISGIIFYTQSQDASIGGGSGGVNFE